ncbi:group II intron reverse transcriptase/maturase [Cardinium endosymbiont of Sogatella furcifera]|uniref:group II intron reverse transcriptase/maturase n=1 Tax=Cardinium endosymbiont of Sogatella furcifera TaxID=650378 RepID=UPI000E0D7331|nr:group II intron reverse transcriptase/maturase [Cardinium endosymbiont of Sogatella furcifera]AXI24060.1 group II intron reverse transcriptase/maturase [Cardinium endosymbiont of Sogatella furcifera]
MIKTPITLQDLRRKIYIKAKADKSWRFWGIYVHVCKLETLRTAYKQAKQNNGSPGIDGVTFEKIEASGLDEFLANIRSELQSKTYFPSRKRNVMIPKDNGHKMRKLSIATIKDRVVEGALKLIMEAIFEADFQPGSYGYRPKRKAAEAIEAVAIATLTSKTKVIDVDLSSYFDTIGHAELFKKVSRRINDRDVMGLLKLIVKAGGKRGISQGGPLSPLLSNIYLNEVDTMLEKAKQVSFQIDGRDHMEYVRWADDLLILIDDHIKWKWLELGIHKRLRQELSKIKVTLNEEKTRFVDLKQGGTFSFLGFDFRRVLTRRGKNSILETPRMKARSALLSKLKVIFRNHISHPVGRVIRLINPILRGWINYFRIGNSRRCFGYIKHWVEKKVRRHLMRARKRKGFGWGRWSRRDLYEKIKLYNDYQIRYHKPSKATTA